MGDRSSLSDEEQHLLTAAQNILKAFGKKKTLNAEFRKFLRDFDTHLDTFSSKTENKGTKVRDIVKQLKDAERIVLSWESTLTMVWESSPAIAAQYLQAIYDIQGVIDSGASRRQKKLFNQAEAILQTAMSRLEKELSHILTHQKHYSKPKYTSSRLVVDDESSVSIEGETRVDLIHTFVIPDLKSIANAMFACNYNQEFCLAYIGARGDALAEYLDSLGWDNFSVEEVLKMDWEKLNSEIKKWMWAMKMIFTFYLVGEKQLCEQIMGDFGSVNATCFVEISKPSILALLSFGEAIAMGPHQPEKLIILMGMCRVLSELVLDVDSLLSDESALFLRREYHELLKKLGDSARAAFMKFNNAIASDEASCPFQGGSVHPICRYVMNFVSVFPKYNDTLDTILKDHNVDNPYGVIEPENGQDISPSTFSPTANHLRLITSTLEGNLCKKSKLYKDESLQHIFLLNNIHYIVQKVKNSELREFVGDAWIREHIVKFQMHATKYQRSAWGCVLSYLKEDGTNVRERCRGFSISFEEVYNNHKRWLIPHSQLREDVQIAISSHLVHAYRFFLGKNATQIGDKYIKYTTENLESSLLNLFEGSPEVLRNSHSRR